MKHTPVIICLSLIFILGSPAWSLVYAEPVKPPGEISYKDRLKSVETLLEKSSATKQIDASGNADAIAHRELAKAHYEKAKLAYEAGDPDRANKELIEATKIMFEAVKMAEKNEITDVKKKRDYKDRLDSINALMEAHERVADEKGRHADGKELKDIVAEKIRNANKLLDEGKLDEARSVLDEAYVAAKIAINSLRGGDTLVRTLNFESKEEEYRYEIDRNDTHKMLFKILNKNDDQSASPNKMTQALLDNAEELRKTAEKQASEGDYEAAIKSLEESTKNLVRALRGSGIYIPG